MVAGPPKALFRRSLQTNLRCHCGNKMVLSGRRKGHDKTGSGKFKRDERKRTIEEVSRKYNQLSKPE